MGRALDRRIFLGLSAAAIATIGGGLAVFLPVGRTIDPATGKDGEGTGIVPDIAAAPTLALQEALTRAGAIGYHAVLFAVLLRKQEPRVAKHLVTLGSCFRRNTRFRIDHALVRATKAATSAASCSPRVSGRPCEAPS